MLKLKLGAKGELVIPKKIREQLGFSREKVILLDVKDKVLELRASADDIVEKCEKRAQRFHQDVSKWVMGDELYEEVF